MKKIAFLLYLSLSTFAYSNFSEGVNSYKKSDYESAFLKWLPLAKEEDGVAQYNVAKLYASGKGVKKDNEKAFKWFKKALTNGIGLAKEEMVSLRPIYFINLKEKRLAKLETERLAKLETERLAKLETERLAKLETERLADTKKPDLKIHKNAHPINRLAFDYMNEENLTNQFSLPKSCHLSRQVKKDCQKVFDWYWQSANKDYTYAQYVLGIIYAQGLGHSENMDSAKYWFNQSKTSLSKKIQKKSEHILKLLQ